jgi:hypothetical protein
MRANKNDGVPLKLLVSIETLGVPLQLWECQ